MSTGSGGGSVGGGGGGSSSNTTTSTLNQFSPSSSQNASCTSSGDATLVLQPGCCIRQKNEIKVEDVKIAAKAIEIISCFVQYRKGVHFLAKYSNAELTCFTCSKIAWPICLA